jgi:hypothetical protein
LVTPRDYFYRYLRIVILYFYVKVAAAHSVKIRRGRRHRSESMDKNDSETRSIKQKWLGNSLCPPSKRTRTWTWTGGRDVREYGLDRFCWWFLIEHGRYCAPYRVIRRLLRAIQCHTTAIARHTVSYDGCCAPYRVIRRLLRAIPCHTTAIARHTVSYDGYCAPYQQTLV